MCMAKDYSDQLLNIYNSIEDSFKDLSDKLSNIDIEEQKILHEIENTNFNACIGFLLAKQLKEIRMRRRNIKNELIPLMNLRNNFLQKNSDLLKSVHTNIIKQEEKAINFKPYQPKERNGCMRLKRSNMRIVSWLPIDDIYCHVFLANGTKNIVRKNNIIDFDESKKVANF